MPFADERKENKTYNKQIQKSINKKNMFTVEMREK